MVAILQLKNVRFYINLCINKLDYLMNFILLRKSIIHSKESWELQYRASQYFKLKRYLTILSALRVFKSWENLSSSQYRSSFKVTEAKIFHFSIQNLLVFEHKSKRLKYMLTHHKIKSFICISEERKCIVHEIQRTKELSPFKFCGHFATVLIFIIQSLNKAEY